jgi:hypothetical protein
MLEIINVLINLVRLILELIKVNKDNRNDD